MAWTAALLTLISFQVRIIFTLRLIGHSQFSVSRWPFEFRNKSADFDDTAEWIWSLQLPFKSGLGRCGWWNPSYAIHVQIEGLRRKQGNLQHHKKLNQLKCYSRYLMFPALARYCAWNSNSCETPSILLLLHWSESKVPEEIHASSWVVTRSQVTGHNWTEAGWHSGHKCRAGRND